MFAIGAGGDCYGHFFSCLSFPSPSPSLWETARYRLKYCLIGPLNPKHPTNHDNISSNPITAKGLKIRSFEFTVELQWLEH